MTCVRIRNDGLVQSNGGFFARLSGDIPLRSSFCFLSWKSVCASANPPCSERRRRGVGDPARSFEVDAVDLYCQPLM